MAHSMQMLPIRKIWQMNGFILGVFSYGKAGHTPNILNSIYGRHNGVDVCYCCYHPGCYQAENQPPCSRAIFLVPNYSLHQHWKCHQSKYSGLYSNINTPKEEPTKREWRLCSAAEGRFWRKHSAISQLTLDLLPTRTLIGMARDFDSSMLHSWYHLNSRYSDRRLFLILCRQILWVIRSNTVITTAVTVMVYITPSFNPRSWYV